MRKQTGNGMTGAKRIRYSEIERIAKDAGMSVSEMGTLYGRDPYYFYESSHAKRKCKVPKSALRFFDALEAKEPLPPRENRITYENVKHLVKYARKTMKEFAPYIGYASGQSLRKHNVFNCGEALLAMDFLKCTQEELVARQYSCKSSQIKIEEIVPIVAHESVLVENDAYLIEALKKITEKLESIGNALCDIDCTLDKYLR